MRTVRKWLVAREIHIYSKVYFEYWHDEFYDTRNGGKLMARILLLIVAKYFFSPYLTINYIKNQECFMDLTCWTHNNLPNYVFMMQKGHIISFTTRSSTRRSPPTTKSSTPRSPPQQSLLLDSQPPKLHNALWQLLPCQDTAHLISADQPPCLFAFLPFCLFAILPLIIERKSMYVNLAAHGFAKKGEVIASSLQDDEPLSRIADLETLVSHLYQTVIPSQWK